MSVNSEICKARSLFLSRGVLNREIIPDKIVYSWVRSKLHNISAELLDIPSERKSLDILSLDKSSSRIIKYLRTIKTSDSVIYYSYSDGSVVYSNENLIQDLPVFHDLSEEAIGTNAAGISIITGENITVTGCEHFSKVLVNYISSSLLVQGDNSLENRIITLITPKRLAMSHQRTLDTLLKHFSPKEEETSVFTQKNSNESENSEVNPVKMTELKTSNDETSILDKSSNSNECKVFTLSIVEANTIKEALEYYKWNLKKASEALGIGRSTLYRKLKEHSIEKQNHVPK